MFQLWAPWNSFEIVFPPVCPMTTSIPAIDSSNVKIFLDSIDAFLFDCDGVLWHGTLSPNQIQNIYLQHCLIN